MKTPKPKNIFICNAKGFHVFYPLPQWEPLPWPPGWSMRRHLLRDIQAIGNDCTMHPCMDFAYQQEVKARREYLKSLGY